MSSDWLSSVVSNVFGVTATSQTSQTTPYAQYAIAQASTFLSSGNYDGAINAFKKAVTLDQNNTTANDYLGRIYLSQGKTKEAITAYKRLVSIQSNLATKDTSTNAPTLAAATISLGNAYLQDKQYDQSEKQFKAAAKLDPRNPLPPYTLGQQYIAQGRFDEALTQLNKAQKLAPNDGNVFYALGAAYNGQGNYMDAASALQTSIQLKPKFPAANYELGIAYNGLNYTEGVQQQQAILNSSDANFASQLAAATKPQMVSIDGADKQNTLYNTVLGSRTPLITIAPSELATPGSSKIVSTVIQFSKDMDYSSITNITNWSISRGNTIQSGFYNSSIPINSRDAKIPPIPLSVTYDSTTQKAVVNFRLSQNSNKDALIDPKHLVFTFNGKDASGQTMDQTANSIDGAATAPFGPLSTLA
jgi:Flp pilus assembly protein TadD